MQVARGAAASSAFAGTVEAQLARLIFLNPEAAPNAAFAPRVAVALSGGADSLALILIADAWVRSHGGSLVALTVDHRLRAESTHEAAQVAEWMRARGIAHHILTPEHTAASTNLQEAARQWRYDALAEYCHAQGILHCLIAHHAGDNRETVLLHQTRGDTADGDSGMAACRNYRGVRFLRPMLGVERAAIEAFLQHHGVAWVEDPSNTNPRFARVRARAQLATDSAPSSRRSRVLPGSPAR